jgi:hypothetical protein
MIRFFTLFSVVTMLLTGLMSPTPAPKSGMVVLGGSHHIRQNESLKENVSFYFAQVTIDEGASVDGQVFLFSSTLDLAGRVTEDIHAFESDLTLRESAQVDGKIDEKDFIHWTFLLPAMVQLP